ncbi:VWA domain-containing protein [Candidatus Bipolaricaulota bacterium]|nr:VWA domain-containing protein [Candidatus Bipolaricaulota bacterium]
MRKGALPFVLFLSLVLPVLPGLADGIIIPIPGPEIPSAPLRWLTIVYHHVTVTIQDGVATTKVDQAFRNETRFPIEGTYVFPLPPGAVIQGFTLWVDGEPVAGELHPADEAREIYLSYLRQNRDPALLEYIGEGAFRAQVFPIDPGETRRIALEYVELLSPEGGVFGYRYPLAPERFSAQPLEEVSVTVVIEGTRPVGSVYSPTHTVAVTRGAPTSAQALYAEKNVLPDRDFLLYYALTGEAVGASLLTHRSPGEDGWFLLLLSPPAVRDEAPLPKDVVLVIDRSGSMGWDGGEKMVQAREAAAFIVRHLGPADRFGVIAFDSSVSDLTPGLVPATGENVANALRAIAALVASGGTNIHESLLRAMGWLEPADRPQYVLFLTDGEATSSVTDTDRIVREVTAANKAQARLFTFGVGYDVNAHLLDLLAENNQGATTYVKPDENLEAALSSFYTKIAKPALSHLGLAVDGVTVGETFPVRLPDLFYGSQIVLFGRYAGAGPAVVTLTGRRGADEVKFAFEVKFPAEEPGAEFLPRLWAARKIGHLLNIIRFEGETEEIKNEIIALATKYGIATPYTSFLVREEERTAAYYADPLAMMVRTGPAAVGTAQATQALTEAETVQRADHVREVSGRVFLLLDGVWQESTYEKNTPTVAIVYLSEAYFHLLDEFPEIGPILALGEVVIFKLGQVWVQIGEEGLTELTPEVLETFRR